MLWPNVHRIFFTLVVFATLLEPARAKEHNEELVPELNVFIKLNQHIRLFLLGDVTQGLSPDYTDGEFGAHLDFTLKPILRRELRHGNWERDRFLWVRTGYLVTTDLDDRDDGSTIQTVLLEMTGRFELPWEIWLVNRGRVDLRDIDGESSQRYRLRLGIEREFKVCGVVIVPYVQAETFFDTRFDTWNRQLYQAGIEIELNKHWRIEPYVARQNDSRSASGNVNRFGLVLKSYF
ncbi:MAG TPA: hypothetical protein VEX43_07355 [Chthoniobacterales bacterium]|nr:hypothetical protein [Chthoniobacterales bacterium]